jgi:hypothetical protein
LNWWGTDFFGGKSFMVKKTALFLILVCAVSCGPLRDEQSPFSLSHFSFDTSEPLLARVKAMPPSVLEDTRRLDENPGYTPYTPTDKEMVIIRDSIDLLPPLTKRVLQQRMVGIYFIRDFLGSGLTNWFSEKGEVYTYMIFNPDVFRQDISGLVTAKDRTVFRSGGRGSVAISCGGKYNGFLYILIHESTHAVDYVRVITPYVEEGVPSFSNPPDSPFTAGVWRGYRETALEYPYQSRVTFYGMKGGPHYSLEEAEDVYRGLSRSPFVSLYSGLNWAEDLAEFITFYHLTEKLKQPYRIEVRGPSGGLFEFEPMENHLVRKRFSHIQMFYR